MILTKILFWIGLGGMAAGIYHQNMPLTVAASAAYIGSVIFISAPIVTILNTKEKEDK